MKKLISLICFILIIGLLTGCVSNNNSPQNEIVDYMEKKYKDNFTYIDSFGGNNLTTNALLRSEKFPEYKITSSRIVEENGKVYYSDNYIQYKYKEETKKYLYDMLKKIFDSQFYLTYEIGTLGTINDFNDKTSFDNFIKSKNNNLMFTVVVSSDFVFEESNLLNELKSKIEISGIQFKNFTIYFSTNDDNYKQFDELSSVEIEQMRRLNIVDNFSKVIWS